jgi:hypothetical protein
MTKFNVILTAESSTAAENLLKVVETQAAVNPAIGLESVRVEAAADAEFDSIPGDNDQPVVFRRD